MVLDQIDIVRGETREIQIDPGTLTAGYETRSYRLAIARSPGGVPIVQLLFGPAEFEVDRWELSLTAAQTASLLVASHYLGVWEIGRPEPIVFRAISVGQVPGSE
jgi:hypothetical protein